MANFSCYDTEKTEWQKSMDIMRQVIASIEIQVEDYQKKADAATGKIMPVEYLGDVFGRRFSDIGSYRGDSYYSDKSPTKCAERAKEWAEKTYAEAKDKHEKNIIAIENNKAVDERVRLFMENIGVKSAHSVRDTSSRSRSPKWKQEFAGYIADLRLYCKVDDGFSLMERDYKKMLEDIEKYISANIKAEEDKKREEQAKEKNIVSERQRAALVVKYGLDYAYGWNELLGVILKKNKYLHLAHYLSKNRGDWSDGYSYAEIGIDNFVSETEQDKDIEACIRGHIEDWCGDGRIFRDCTWNYDRIFGLIEDADLLADYQIVANKESEL